jgi:hypothetical protein
MKGHNLGPAFFVNQILSVLAGPAVLIQGYFSTAIFPALLTATQVEVFPM